MTECKYCLSKKLVKNGIVHGKQRYLCKDCKRTFRIGDAREKYSRETKIKVVKMYLEGIGIRAIERLEGVPNPLIIQWIKKFSEILRAELSNVKIADNARDIQILELDEMFSYCQKKLTKSTFGKSC